MKKKTVLLFVFEGFADWEPAYALVGISKSNAYQIKTIAMDKTPKKSMGGVSVLPDFDFLNGTDLKDLDDSNTAMLILPGGVAWEEKTNAGIAPLVEHCFANSIAVAAICGATIFLADLGLLNDLHHTSNDVGYLQSMSSVYRGHHFYQFKPSISAQNIITASGTASVEFAGAIFKALDISKDKAVSGWFQYFDAAGYGATRIYPPIIK